MIGKTLGHYEILEKLGSGGMGDVYRARDMTLDRGLALKVLSTGKAHDPERLRRFDREAKAVAALKHPNIVTIYSIEEEDGVRFLTMELVEGQTLSDLLPDNGLSLDLFSDLAVPLADAVSNAHANGITHRDLKPANIMVDSDGRLKILDFGLAKLLEPESEFGEAGSADVTKPLPGLRTEEGRVLGTVAYMSPEQAEGKAVDHRSDIFSLGIVFYEMITGRRPFQGDSRASTISSILRDTPTPVTELKRALPPHVGRILDRCLAKDVESRYQSALDLKVDLEELRQETESRVSLESHLTSIRSSARRRIRLLVGAAITTALVMLMIAVAHWRLRSGSRSSPTEHEARKMIVVLPFENLGLADDDYFTAGMTEEITSKLALVSGLGVISRTSALQYDRTGKTIKEIGDDLGVDYVLEGTVCWDRLPGGESRVRITPRLVETSEDTHVWAESYERVIEDVFAVQAEIAEQVVQQLDVTLLASEREALGVRPTDSQEAYEAYLRGRYYDKQKATYSKEDHFLAVRMYERATELDPDFALAYAALGGAHLLLYVHEFDHTEERLSLAKSALDRALALQRRLPEAHLQLGYYYYWAFRDYERALEEFKIAADGRPNEPLEAPAYIWRRQGHFDKSLRRIKEVMLHRPEFYLYTADFVISYEYLRDYSEAAAYLDRAVRAFPDHIPLYIERAFVELLSEGDVHEARSILNEVPGPIPEEGIGFWYSLDLMEGDYRSALERIDSLETDYVMGRHGYSRPRFLLKAFAHRLLGESALARSSFDAARKFLENRAKARPDDHFLRSQLGIAYAGLGRDDDAIREGRLAADLMPVSKDALDGPLVVADLAFIYVLLGREDAAVEQIEYLLSIPSPFSIPYLRIDPRWSPLMENSRFLALLARGSPS